MKRFIIVLFTAVLWTIAVNAQTSDLVTALLTPDELMDNSNVETARIGNDEPTYANPESSDTKKGRGKSVSKSVSTSNGKTVSTTSAAVSGRDKIKSVESLAVFELFGDKYKRVPGCSLTVIDNKESNYRSLDVENNPEVIKEIKRLVNIDREKAASVMETYSEDGDRIIMSFDKMTVGFDDYINGTSCKIFINW